jgi:hypothetical protein
MVAHPSPFAVSTLVRRYAHSFSKFAGGCQYFFEAIAAPVLRHVHEAYYFLVPDFGLFGGELRDISDP